MSIDARIRSITHTDQGNVVLRLASYRQSDGTMSIAGTDKLTIRRPTQEIHVGQQIWGNSGHVVVEAGQGGKRVEYLRHGNVLTEVQRREQRG